MSRDFTTPHKGAFLGHEELGTHRQGHSVERTIMERAEQTVLDMVPPEDVRMVMEMLFQPPQPSHYGATGRRLYGRD